MTKKLYADRDPSTLEPHYSAHVCAMTAEALHAKSAIAAELAWRDKRIAELEAAAAPLVFHWQRIKRIMSGRAPAELQVAGVDLERLDVALRDKTDAE